MSGAHLSGAQLSAGSTVGRLNCRGLICRGSTVGAQLSGAQLSAHRHIIVPILSRSVIPINICNGLWFFVKISVAVCGGGVSKFLPLYFNTLFQFVFHKSYGYDVHVGLMKLQVWCPFRPQKVIGMMPR